MSKLLEGYFRAIKAISPHTDGGIVFKFYKLPKNKCLNTQIEQLHIEGGGDPEQLPKLSHLCHEDFIKFSSQFISGAVPAIRSYPIVIELIDILNEEFAPFKIYGEFDSYECGERFLMVLDGEKERTLIDLDWTYD